MKYYIGVDGGGTKTAFALFDENKNSVAFCEGKASNHENMEGSFPEAAGVIADGIGELLGIAGISLSEVDGILMGLAGIDHPYQHDAMQAELKKLGIENAHVYNDGFIVIKAGVGAGAGIGYNCGTGTCCNSIDDNGNMLQVGGFDTLSGDKGNGHWVATQSFRAVYDEICLGKKETLITKLMAEKAGITDRESLLETIAKLESEEAESYIRMFIGSFFEAANSGDEVALEIIDEMAQRGADFIAAHIKKMAFAGETVNVVLSGSMHTKLPSDLYIEAMGKKLAASVDKKINFIKLDVPPVTGCINWLLEN